MQCSLSPSEGKMTHTQRTWGVRSAHPSPTHLLSLPVAQGLREEKQGHPSASLGQAEPFRTQRSTFLGKEGVQSPGTAFSPHELKRNKASWATLLTQPP